MLTVAQLSGSAHYFMEPEGSLPYSQQPNTGPYHKQENPVDFNPILILSYCLRLNRRSDYLPSGFQIKMHESFIFPIHATFLIYFCTFQNTSVRRCFVKDATIKYSGVDRMQAHRNALLSGLLVCNIHRPHSVY
jgi:hypothetical protein